MTFPLAKVAQQSVGLPVKIPIVMPSLAAVILSPAPALKSVTMSFRQPLFSLQTLMPLPFSKCMMVSWLVILLVPLHLIAIALVVTGVVATKIHPGTL